MDWSGPSAAIASVSGAQARRPAPLRPPDHQPGRDSNLRRPQGKRPPPTTVKPREEIGRLSPAPPKENSRIG